MDQVHLTSADGKTVPRVMTLRGVRYVEAKADESKAGAFGEVCSQCALGQAGMLTACYEAINWMADRVFGGDCESRDVIYRVESSPLSDQTSPNVKEGA